LSLNVAKELSNKEKTKPKVAPPPAIEPRPPESVAQVVPRSQFSHELLSVYFHSSKQDGNNFFCTHHKRQKNLVGVASADRTERTTALLRAKNQKSILCRQPS
jgi:hypothetical protein